MIRSSNVASRQAEAARGRLGPPARPKGLPPSDGTPSHTPARRPPVTDRAAAALGGTAAWPGQDALHSMRCCTQARCTRVQLHCCAALRYAALRCAAALDAGARRQDAVRLISSHMAAAVLELLEVLGSRRGGGGEEDVSIVSKAAAHCMPPFTRDRSCHKHASSLRCYSIQAPPASTQHPHRLPTP